MEKLFCWVFFFAQTNLQKLHVAGPVLFLGTQLHPESRKQQRVLVMLPVVSVEVLGD